MAQVTRLSINISEDTAAALRELAAKHDMTVTDVVRRVVGVYKYLEDETKDNSKRLQIVDRRRRRVMDIELT